MFDFAICILLPDCATDVVDPRSPNITAHTPEKTHTGHAMSNHPMVETVPPPPDFDKNLHIWSIWSEKKICQIIAYFL